MKRIRKLSMFSQLLLAFCGVLIPLVIICIIYITDVHKAYFDRSVENAGFQLEQTARLVNSRMVEAETYLAPNNYNMHQLRLRNLKPDEEIRLAANLYWQDLNQQVIYNSGADAYFFFLPDRDYADIALKYEYLAERGNLKNYILNHIPEWSGNKGWCVIEADGISWLMYAAKHGNLYVGAFFFVSGITDSILKSIGYSSAEAFVEASPSETPEGFLRIERVLSRKLNAVLLLNKREVNSRLPSVRIFIIIALVVIMLSIPVLAIAFTRILVRPVRILTKAMGELEEGNPDYRITEPGSNTDAERLNGHFNTMADSLTDMKIRVYEQELEKMDIEATNLRLQVNPHFILNSLNIIFSMAKSSKPNALEQIRSFTKYLADYLRYALWNTGGKVTLKAEIQCVQNYLELQKVRFPGRFLYLCDVDEELERGLIPPLLILNFVENTIKYALDPERQIEVYIIAKRVEDKLCISVCDTGNGMDELTVNALMGSEILENESGRHIGVWNCRRRMNLLYGERASFHITSRPQEGTQVFLEIPWEEKEDELTDRR